MPNARTVRTIGQLANHPIGNVPRYQRERRLESERETSPLCPRPTRRLAPEESVSRADHLPRYLKPEEVADLLRTSRKAIYVMIERRQLPGVIRIGRRLLISANDLLSWLSDQQDTSSLEEIKR